MGVHRLAADGFGPARGPACAVAEALIASLGRDVEIELSWSDVIVRRIQSVRSEGDEEIPAETVFAEMDDLLR